jgi:hypothetical protein
VVGPHDGEPHPTTGKSALRIVTDMTADEFAAPESAPLPSTQPVGRAGRASPTLQGRHGAAQQAAVVSSMARAAMPRAGRARRRSRASLRARRPDAR